MTNPATRPRTWTPALLTQLVAVVAVLVSGVIGAGSLRSAETGADVLRVVSAAGSSAASANTFRSTFEFALDGLGTKITSRGEMLVDVERKLQSASLDAPGIGRLELIQAGDHIYVKVPGGKADPSGKHWYGLPAKGGAAAFGSQDPLALLHVMADPEDVRLIGEETISSTRTTHYSVELDPERLGQLNAQNPDAPALPPAVLSQVKNATADVWLDANDLPRRMRMSLSVQQINVRFSFDFFDYGLPVQITAPAAEDVAELSGAEQLVPLLQGSSSG